MYENGDAAAYTIRNYVCDGHPTYKMTDVGTLAAPHRPYVASGGRKEEYTATSAKRFHVFDDESKTAPSNQFDIPTSDSNGTFVGTAGDPWAPELGRVGSPLDGIFVYRGSVVRDSARSGAPHAWVWNYTGSEKEPSNLLHHRNLFPSDHLGLVADIQLWVENHKQKKKTEYITGDPVHRLHHHFQQG